MTSGEMPAPSTTAPDAMFAGLAQPVVVVVMVAAGLGVLGTTMPLVETPRGATKHAIATTSADAPVVAIAPAKPRISELRLLTGLTWDQLATLFGVSRRSVHFWVSGQAMSASNEEHLRRLLEVVREVDRGFARDNRAALLAARADGPTALELLEGKHYDRVRALLGPGVGRRPRPPRISLEAQAARTPPPPDQLVGALHDRVHHESGVVRSAKSVKVPNGR